MRKYILILVWILLAGFVTQAQTSDDLPALDNLDDGWNAIATGGMCSSGTPYEFLVNPSETSDDLLVFFTGGGACWEGQACDVTTQPLTHTPFVDATPREMATAGGIFARDNDENPFADYHMIFLPYCTGDVFVGSGEREYTYSNADDDEVTVTVFHNGYENAMTVLDWVADQYDAPDNVVVAGSSAGAIGAAFYAGFIAEHYAETPVTLIGDGAGGYASPAIATVFNAWDTASILPEWDAYTDATNDTLTFEDFYIASALQAENLTLAQYNTARDSVQIGFTLLLDSEGGAFSLQERIFDNYALIEEGSDQELYTYTAGGAEHTILWTDLIYEYTVDDVRFVDWLADLINGEPVSDISCAATDAGCFAAP